MIINFLIIIQAAMNLYEKMKSGIYVIAEMSANHAGKIENAFKIIEEAAKASADCVKIQTYTADTLTIDCDDSKYVIIRICQQLYFSDTLFS